MISMTKNIEFFMEHVFNMWISVESQMLSLSSRHMKAPVQQLHTHRHASEAKSGRTHGPHIFPSNLISPSCHWFSHPAHYLYQRRVGCKVQRSRACQNLISALTSYVSWASFFCSLLSSQCSVKSNLFNLLFSSGTQLPPLEKQHTFMQTKTT